MPKGSTKAAKRQTRNPSAPAGKISNRELLIHWAVVLQHQQLWIAQIIESLGAPLLPGLCNQIRRTLSLDHFKAWLEEEEVSLYLILGLLEASREERSVRAEIARRLKGKIVSSLLDVMAGKTGQDGDLTKDVKEIRSAIMVDRIREKFPNEKFSITEENEDAKSYAFFDGWKELARMAESIIEDPWRFPAAENEFEAVLFQRWQSQVLPALKGLGIQLLPILLKTKDVNYIPSSLAKDRIDRLKAKKAKKRTGIEIEYDEFLDDELFASAWFNKSAEDEAIDSEGYANLVRKVYKTIDKHPPEIRRAFGLILRGHTQKDAAAIEGLHESTLNERIIKIREDIKKTN
jgi:hypothetical protein